MAQETFSCLVTPPQVYISSDSENPNTVTLTASITNVSGADIDVKAVQVILPIGNETGALTASDTGIGCSTFGSGGAEWVTSPLGNGRFKAIAAEGIWTVANGAAVTMTFQNVMVEPTTGAVDIGFTVQSTAGTETYDVTVNKVMGSLSIDSLSADATTVVEGQTVELSWATTNASRVSISPGDFGDLDTNGSLIVTPRKTTTFTLTVWGSGPVQTRQIDIQIARVGVLEFKVDDPKPAAGQEVTLSWTTELATEVTLMPGDISVDVNGSCVVSPTEPTVYQLIAVAEDGSQAFRNCFVHVQPVEIKSFTVDLTQDEATGEYSSLLKWDVSYANKLAIQWVPSGMTDQYATPAVGATSFVHNPEVGGMYVLIAEGYTGPVTKEEVVTIPIEISDFEGQVSVTTSIVEDVLAGQAATITAISASAIANGAQTATLAFQNGDGEIVVAETAVSEGEINIEVTFDKNSPAPFTYNTYATTRLFTLTVSGVGNGNVSVLSGAVFAAKQID